MKLFHLNKVIEQLTTNDTRLQISTVSRVQPAFISLPVSHHCFYRGAQTTKSFPRSSFKHPTKLTLDTILKKAEQKTCSREMQWHSCWQFYHRHVLYTATSNVEKHFSAWTLCSMNCLYKLTPATLQCLFMAYIPLGSDRLFPDLYRRHAVMSKQKPCFHWNKSIISLITDTTHQWWTLN